jgi:DNA mismatch repair protein MutS2
MIINEKYCKVLELDKILQMLSEYTCCDYAKERALSIKPFTNLRIVKDEVEKTNDAFLLSSKFGTPSFANLKDPSGALKLADAGGMISLPAFINLAEILRQTKLLCEWIRQCQNMENKLQEIFSFLEPNKALEDRIRAVVISEDRIDDFASVELSDIRRKITSTQAKAKQNIEKIIRSSKYQKVLQENIVTIRDGRFVIPVKAEFKGEIPGLVHDTSSSGATLFIEPMAVVDANNEIRVLELKEKAEIERILYELSALCAEHKENILNNFDVIITLNIYFAKSHLAAKMNAMMPAIVDTGEVVLRKARHPLIHKDEVVPISVELGEKYKTLVITGPNTGGKTVTLKTIGLLTLMTMCGLLIPVSDNSTVSVFQKVLVDIGDEQSIEQSLSTFSAHMTNIVSILKEADENSLILVDELGSGTDPVEGAAIAVSVLEELREKGSITAATTHYPELKMYAIETENVENACCEFDVKTLRPTYRLLIGVPGRSNAFAISRRLGLSEEVLQKAQTLISQQDQKLETVVDRLEKSRQEYEEKYREYNQKVYDYRNRTQIIEEEKRKLEKQKEQIIEAAREQARKIVETVKAQSQNLMDELEELRRQKDSEEFSKRTSQARSQLRGKLDKLHSQANPVTAKTNDGYRLPRPLKRGDDVLVVDIDKRATVLEEADKAGNIMVQAGIMKMRVKVANLRLVEQKNPYKQTGRTIRSTTKAVERRASTEIDLRGQTVEEALMDVDFFIDRAILSHLEQITIIHGKGTGALRSAIHRHLKSHKSVKSFRLGTFGEGEAGVTIVELK